MARIYKPRVWVDGYRKQDAYCVAVRDPWRTLKEHGWNTSESRNLSRKRSSGALMLYNDGSHLYTDLRHFRSLFDGYERNRYWHSGLHFVPREKFRTAQNIHDQTKRFGFYDNPLLYLQHNGFTGKAGERTAHVWFATHSQKTRPWLFSIAPGTILNLITDCEDWCLETIWIRKDRNVRKDLLSLKRKL